MVAAKIANIPTAVLPNTGVARRARSAGHLVGFHLFRRVIHFL
jgi:hypothetical protein